MSENKFSNEDIVMDAAQMCLLHRRGKLSVKQTVINTGFPTTWHATHQSNNVYHAN